MKRCGSCNSEKPLSDFNKKGSGYQSKCRECQKEWYANYYVNSDTEKERLGSNRKKKNEKIRELIKSSKSVPCMDCGQKYPYYVMDFDHRDPAQKEFTIARYAMYSIKQIKAEIEKCDVVCSNCHRERTHCHRLDTGQDTVV